MQRAITRTITRYMEELNGQVIPIATALLAGEGYGISRASCINCWDLWKTFLTSSKKYLCDGLRGQKHPLYSN